MVLWRLSASGQWLSALVALGALTACANTPGEPRDGAGADGWRVVERVGEARHLPPGDGTWRATITGQAIVDGSEVTTGSGGRLIITRPGRHLSVGPASRFVLPHPDWDDRLEQRAGWLRYRVESTDAEPFRVRTRSLAIEIVAAILDVRVDQDAVDVTVTQGQGTARHAGWLAAHGSRGGPVGHRPRPRRHAARGSRRPGTRPGAGRSADHPGDRSHTGDDPGPGDRSTIDPGTRPNGAVGARRLRAAGVASAARTRGDPDHAGQRRATGGPGRTIRDRGRARGAERARRTDRSRDGTAAASSNA